MCAIAGLVCIRNSCETHCHVTTVRRICDVQAHRGPDDQGIVALEAVCLGSNRLKILDLSAAAHMPMSDAAGRRWIVYNGETYNFRDLREELLRCGHTFTSNGDTEVVLNAFAQWGEEALTRLVGMFAFAIYDRDTRTVTLARDRFGKKPLYYLQQDGHLYFASEVKALLRVLTSITPNYHRLIEWSLYRNAELGSPETPIEGSARCFQDT